jgi:hypothetical protein
MVRCIDDPYLINRLPRNPRTHAPKEEEEEESRDELHPVIATTVRSSAHELTTAAVEQ